MPTNYSYSSGIAPTLLESYLQRRALQNVEPNLGYLKDAQMISQPLNSGSKHVKFFRYTELPAITAPLQEGVTPDAQALTETAFSVMTKQYGGYMDYTDEIDLWHVDKKTQAMSDRLNRQAQLSIDTVGRDAICAGLNVMYPSGITARGSITASNIITYAMIKKAVRNLKKKGAQPFADGFYHAKIDHETYYDLSGDSHWTDVAKYQDDSRVQKYELGTIYKVKFFEVDNGKVFKNQSYLYGTTAALTAYADYVADSREIVVTATMTEDEARELTGKLVYVQYSSSYNTLMCVERVYPSGTANQTKILFRWDPGASVTTNWTTANTLKIVPCGGGSSNAEVHASIIYGQNAFGCVSLGSAKQPNFKIIVKPLGSAGATDPLDQRGTVAWKVPFFACAVLQDDFIVRLEHGVSA
jgi:N4-gp56 family major capsid protein